MSKIEFAVVGDLVPGGKLSGQNIDPLKGIYSKFSSCNFIWANLECAVPFEYTPIKNRSSKVPGDLEVLKRVTCNRKFTFSMANNHAMDYNLQNLLKTKMFLNEKNIQVFGVGNCQEEARKPFLFEKDGIKIGLATYSSDAKWVGDHLQNKPGEFISILNKKTIEEVKEYSRLVDYLFVALHFGKEFIDYPVPNDREIARALIDNGASAVFGHHPHVFQGYEIYKGKPIFYSLGNFLFPSFNKPQKLRWSKKESTGLSIKVNIADKENFQWEIIPTYYDHRLAVVKEISGRKYKKTLSRLNRISKPLAYGKVEYQNKFNSHLKYVSSKLISRGIIRNILKPKAKHLTMFLKLTKQVLPTTPAKKST